MSRSPSDINTKNIHILTCDLGWSNGYLFRLSSRRPEIESRRGSCWLSLLTSFNWIDFFSFGYVKDTLVHIEAVCRAQMPIFLLGKWKTRRQSRAGLSWFYHVAITIKSCPLMLGSSMVRPFSSLGGWVALTSSLFWLPVSVAILLNKDPKYKKEPCLGRAVIHCTLATELSTFMSTLLFLRIFISPFKVNDCMKEGGGA